MSWGLPPKYKASKIFTSESHEQIISMARDTVTKFGYTVTNETPYTLTAFKKLPMSFFSFFSFTRPKLDTHIRADEDGKMTVEIHFNYSSGYIATFNDLGKSKRHVEQIIHGVTF